MALEGAGIAGVEVTDGEVRHYRTDWLQGVGGFPERIHPARQMHE